MTDILITLLNSCQTALISNFDRKELFGSFVGSNHRYLRKADCSSYVCCQKNSLWRASSISRRKTKQAGPMKADNPDALLACLLWFIPATSARSLKWIYAAATYSANSTRQGRWYVLSIMSMILTLSLALKHFYGYVPWDFLPIEPNVFVSFKK